MNEDQCRPVEVDLDGEQTTIRVRGGVELTPEDVQALAALVTVARAKVATEHPHAGVIQELMLAWMAVRRAMPANDSRVGRDRNVAAVKQRMSDAIVAVRAALDERAAES
jgi:hypothetical protein